MKHVLILLSLLAFSPLFGQQNQTDYDGKKHGKWWEWYENGRMKVAGDFLDGYALDLTVWKPDGTLCRESGVSAGFGYWLSYDSDGNETRRSEIANGELVYDLEEEEDEEEESES